MAIYSFHFGYLQQLVQLDEEAHKQWERFLAEDTILCPGCLFPTTVLYVSAKSEKEATHKLRLGLAGLCRECHDELMTGRVKQGVP